uniref:Uncharacterized protein n=1 Tax=Arundo donax TaxID=35708 RepID=A0A0A9CJ25_ARUDO
MQTPLRSAALRAAGDGRLEEGS